MKTVIKSKLLCKWVDSILLKQGRIPLRDLTKAKKYLKSLYRIKLSDIAEVTDFPVIGDT